MPARPDSDVKTRERFAARSLGWRSFLARGFSQRCRGKNWKYFSPNTTFVSVVPRPYHFATVRRTIVVAIGV